MVMNLMIPGPGVMLLANMRFILFVVAPVRYRAGGAFESPPPLPPYSELAAMVLNPHLGVTLNPLHHREPPYHREEHHLSRYRYTLSQATDSQYTIMPSL